jgi:hypothetical protein
MPAAPYAVGERMIADLTVIKGDDLNPITDAVITGLGHRKGYFEVRLSDGTEMTLGGQVIYRPSARRSLTAYQRARGRQREAILAIRSGDDISVAQVSKVDLAVLKAENALRRVNPYWPASWVKPAAK